MDIKERIQKYLDSKGIKTASFEREVGLSNGYWKKTKSISANIVSDILRTYSDLSSDYVLKGIGNMLDNCGCSSADDASIYHPSSDGTCTDFATEAERTHNGGTTEDIAFYKEQAEFYKQQASFYKEQAEFYKQQASFYKEQAEFYKNHNNLA